MKTACPEIVQAVSAQSIGTSSAQRFPLLNCQTLSGKLSYSYYTLLMSLDNCMQIARKTPQRTPRTQSLDEKVLQQNSTRMTRIIRMITDPCASAPSAPSAFYRADPRTKSTDGGGYGFISIDPQFFYNVINNYQMQLNFEGMKA